ncbi:expressed protein [Phakopsora pachyrhizi]|uniref:Expressed protein n=1 Tax=Phakopsora pachyrhizi TaxID=170000 RepID=A0AAV0AZL6_PHAPC|nr:expressed protein [Phakopsora pachyrhizi]
MILLSYVLLVVCFLFYSDPIGIVLDCVVLLFLIILSNFILFDFDIVFDIVLDIVCLVYLVYLFYYYYYY